MASIVLTTSNSDINLTTSEGDGVTLVASNEIILGVGVRGPAGEDAHYEHTQGAASTTWVITHALGKKPSVIVLASSGDTVIGDITYDSDNQLTITFSAAFSGTAYLN